MEINKSIDETNLALIRASKGRTVEKKICKFILTVIARSE